PACGTARLAGDSSYRFHSVSSQQRPPAAPPHPRPNPTFPGEPSPMTIATTTIRRATADALPTLSGLDVECTAYRAPDNDGFAIVAFHRGAAIVLQITG